MKVPEITSLVMQLNDDNITNLRYRASSQQETQFIKDKLNELIYPLLKNLNVSRPVNFEVNNKMFFDEYHIQVTFSQESVAMLKELGLWN